MRRGLLSVGKMMQDKIIVAIIIVWGLAFLHDLILKIMGA